MLFTQKVLSFESDTDKLDVFIGSYFPTAETLVRFDSALPGDGSSITLEDDLAVEAKTTLLAVKGIYRFSQKSSMEFEYFDLSRKGKTQIETEIVFGDQTFMSNIQIDSTFDAEVYRLAYRHQMFSTNKFQIGGMLGIHASDYDASLSAPEIYMNDSKV